MIHEKPRIKTGLLLIALLLIFSAFIFVRSGQTSDKSSEESALFIKIIAGIIDNDFKDLPENKRHEYVEGFQFTARKFAHFTAYAVIGAIGAAAAWSFRLNILYGFIYSIIFAASDEIHQYFVPGRSCEFRDFIIDSAGAAAGVLFFAAATASLRALINRLSLKGKSFE